MGHSALPPAHSLNRAQGEVSVLPGVSPHSLKGGRTPDPPLMEWIYAMSAHSLTHPRTGPKHPGALATPTELCEFWQAMDAYYGTEPDTPLHHDGRCEVHASWLIRARQLARQLAH